MRLCGGLLVFVSLVLLSGCSLISKEEAKEQQLTIITSGDSMQGSTVTGLVETGSNSNIDIIKSTDPVVQSGDEKIIDRGFNINIPSDRLTFTKDSSGEYGWEDNLEMITHEDGQDPTQVRIYLYNLNFRAVWDMSLAKIAEDPIYDGSKTKEEDIILNNEKTLKITAYQRYNDCNYTEYLHQIDENKTSVVVISAICPTHPVGYDESKKSVAESVKFNK